MVPFDEGAVGGQDDVTARLRDVLPIAWFPDRSDVLGAVLAGLAATWSWVFSLLSYVASQTRIATATDLFLDLVAEDFFGSRFARATGEDDTSYRRRISLELLRERATRNAVTSVLTDLTGRKPKVFEPARSTDTGGYVLGGVGYGAGGGWGSLVLPFQCFVTAYRPLGDGVNGLAGYGVGGWGISASGYGGLAETLSVVTDAQIAAAVASVMPAAATAWLRIEN